MRRTRTTPGSWRRCSLRTIEARNHCTRVVGSAGVPDFKSELVASAVDGDTEWGEWSWRGHHVDGSRFAMRGVTIFVMRDGLVTEGRLYMEPVEAGGVDIAAAVQELYRPPPPSSD
jgi:ketosteroid isomerase-like protein